MNKLNARNLLILISFSALIAACSTSPREHPTHYWQATDAKTEREYRIDNDTCNSQLGIDDAIPMPTESPSFEAYRNCMVEKGYVLRSYL